jgi:hypothetical protein
MRNLLACLGLMGIIFLTVSCVSESIAPFHNELAVPSEERVSRALTGTVTMDFNHQGYGSDKEFLLTLSNSTAEPILVPLSKYGCYRDTFWFYNKTEMGWHPMMPVLSQRCYYSPPGEIIPPGFEKVLNIGVIAFTRGVGHSEAASYMLRIKYTDPVGQEFSLYTNEFDQGTPTPIDEFGITIEKAASNTLDWKLTNHSQQSVWLAPLCSSSKLSGGTIDEERSTLQRLTAAGSWSNLPVTCKLAPVTEIPQGTTMMLDGRQWLEDAGIALQPGQYRWDLVFFLKALDEPRLSAVGEGRHIFSQVFPCRTEAKCKAN